MMRNYAESERCETERTKGEIATQSTENLNARRPQVANDTLQGKAWVSTHAPQAATSCTSVSFSSHQALFPFFNQRPQD